jgi:hypothetical protein
MVAWGRNCLAPNTQANSYLGLVMTLMSICDTFEGLVMYVHVHTVASGTSDFYRFSARVFLGLTEGERQGWR